MDISLQDFVKNFVNEESVVRVLRKPKKDDLRYGLFETVPIYDTLFNVDGIIDGSYICLTEYLNCNVTGVTDHWNTNVDGSSIEGSYMGIIIDPNTFVDKKAEQTGSVISRLNTTITELTKVLCTIAGTDVSSRQVSKDTEEMINSTIHVDKNSEDKINEYL